MTGMEVRAKRNGKPSLVWNGYIYIVDNNKGDRMYWKCSKDGCPARTVTKKYTDGTALYPTISNRKKRHEHPATPHRRRTLMRFERNSDTNKHVLHHDGFTYDLDSEADGKKHWRCQHKGCDGLAVSKIGEGKGKRNLNADLTVGHNHSTSCPECSKCKKLSLPELRLESGTMKCGLPACETYIHPSCGKALRGHQGKRYVFCSKKHRSKFVKRIEEEEDKSNTSERETYPEASDVGEGSVNENSDADQRSDGRPKKKVQQDKEKSASASSSEADLPSLDDGDNLEDDHDEDMEDDDDLPTLPDWMRESAEQHEEENDYAAASCSSISASDKKSKRPKATDAGAKIGKRKANLLQEGESTDQSQADAFHPDGNHSEVPSFFHSSASEVPITSNPTVSKVSEVSSNFLGVLSASRSNVPSASCSKVSDVPSASRSTVPSASRSKVSKVPSASRSKVSKVPSASRSKVSNVTSTSRSKVSNVPSTSRSNAPSASRSNASDVPSASCSKVSNVPSASRSKVSDVPSASRSDVPSTSRSNVSNVPSASRSNVPPTSCSDVSESDSDTPLVQNGAGPSASGLTATSSQQPTGAKRPRTQSPTCENGLREEEDNDPKTDLTSEYLRSKIRKNNLISDKTQREITLLKEKELQEELTRRKTQKEMEMLDEKRRREDREHELIVEKMQREIELIKKRCEREAEKTEKDKEMCRRAEKTSRREEEESRVRRAWYESTTHNQ